MNSDAANPSDNSKGEGKMVLLVVLILIGFASGGYYFGTQAKFKSLSGGGSVSASGQEAVTFGGFAESSQLKKTYKLHSKGYSQAGHKIRVLINNQFAGSFYNPDIDIECTKFIKPGQNTITFEAKSLPLDQRSDNSAAELTIELQSCDKKMEGSTPRFENSETLVDYQRKIVDTADDVTTKEFVTLE